MKIKKVVGVEREYAILPTIMIWKTDFSKSLKDFQVGNLGKSIHYVFVLKFLNRSVGLRFEIIKG